MGSRLSKDVAWGVGDIDAAVAFYHEAYGWEVSKRTSEWVEMTSGDIRIYLCDDDVTVSVFEMLVDDVAEAVVRLKALGCVEEPLDPSGKEVYMRDPFGKVYCLSKAPSP